MLRDAADGRLHRVGGAARTEPRIPDALGADLAGRRPHPQRLPPAAAPLRRGRRNDHAYAFFVFRKPDRALVGGLTLANIRRGVAQAGSLGYWMGAALRGPGLHVGCGARAGALRLRLAAAAPASKPPASRPMRRRSRLLERVGFQREGLARQYLCINGVWQDHLLYALIRNEWTGWPVDASAMQPHHFR